MMDLLSVSIVVLAACSLLLPLFQLSRRPSKNWSGYVLAIVLAVVLAMVGVNSLRPATGTLFGPLLASDQLGGLFAIVTLGVTLAVTVASFDLIKSINNPVYYSLLSFTALGMLLLAFAQDLLMLFVAWELMSLPTYVLAGFTKKIASNEAAVKYAIIGAMSSAIILYAISLAYGLTGYTQISAVVRALAAQPPSVLSGIAVLLFIAGFGFKMSIVPFHMWIPDAYEGAPTTISALLAAATKKAGFISAIRVLLAITTLYIITQNSVFTVANIFAALALLTMTLGNVAALTQKSMTRLLAYSSIAQAGYILIGFVPFASNPQSTAAILGMTGSLMQVVNHAIMKGVAFLAVGLVFFKLNRADVGAFSGLSKRMPITAFTIAIAFLALAGVPPLSGFWGKLLLFLSVANGPFGWLAVAGILNSALSIGYYGLVVKRMYMDDPESNERAAEPLWYIVIFAIAVGLIVGIGLFPQPLINFASGAVPSVFPH
jgi:proton-translocating NADH-quinone oxidoreductase chain N